VLENHLCIAEDTFPDRCITLRGGGGGGGGGRRRRRLFSSFYTTSRFTNKIHPNTHCLDSQEVVRMKSKEHFSDSLKKRM